VKPTLGPLADACGFLAQNAKSSSIPCPQQQYLLFSRVRTANRSGIRSRKGPLTQAEPPAPTRRPGAGRLPRRLGAIRHTQARVADRRTRSSSSASRSTRSRRASRCSTVNTLSHHPSPRVGCGTLAAHTPASSAQAPSMPELANWDADCPLLSGEDRRYPENWHMNRPSGILTRP
jgi:hypothetical protein